MSSLHTVFLFAEALTLVNSGMIYDQMILRFEAYRRLFSGRAQGAREQVMLGQIAE